MNKSTKKFIKQFFVVVAVILMVLFILNSESFKKKIFDITHLEAYSNLYNRNSYGATIYPSKITINKARDTVTDDNGRLIRVVEGGLPGVFVDENTKDTYYLRTGTNYIYFIEYVIKDSKDYRVLETETLKNTAETRMSKLVDLSELEFDKIQPKSNVFEASWNRKIAGIRTNESVFVDIDTYGNIKCVDFRSFGLHRDNVDELVQMTKKYISEEEARKIVLDSDKNIKVDSIEIQFVNRKLCWIVNRLSSILYVDANAGKLVSFKDI